MSSMAIVKSDGTKVPATREQIIQMAKWGEINPYTKIEVLGRVVPARKLEELVPIFEARGLLPKERKPDAGADESFGDDSSRFEPGGGSSFGGNASVETRARARTSDAFGALVIASAFIKITGVIVAIGSVIGCFFLEFWPTFLNGILACLFLYSLYGFFRAFIYFILQSTEDSIRQEDFYNEVMKQLKEMNNSRK